jgi:type 1 glutamine amidotransferase
MKSFRQLALFVCWAGLALPAVRGAEPPPRSHGEIRAVLAQAPAPPPAQSLRGVHVVLVADVADHGPGAHDYPIWQERWAALLGGNEAGNDLPVSPGAPGVTVSTAWKWPSDEQFRTADALVFFCYRSGGAPRTWDEARLERLENYAQGGGGLVVIHSATYTGRLLSDEADGRVAAVTGLVYDRAIRYRHGPVELKVALPDHPICRGLPPRIAFVDEPYWPPHGDLAKVQVLATSDEVDPADSSRAAEQPLFWTYQPGQGRVFGCVMGHYNWTFDDAYFRIFLLRGIAWAAGESPYRLDGLVLAGLQDESPVD